MKSSESITKIATALLSAQSNMGNATKGASNPYFKSSYADLNSIREAVTPALNANKITLLQPTTVIDGKSFVETVLLHESGEFLSSLTEIVVSKTNDPQAAGSAISYARRYGLQSFLSVGAVDDDAEKAMNRGPSPAQVKYEAKKEAKTQGVAVTGDIDLKGTSAPPSSTSVQAAQAVSELANKELPKKGLFQKPGSVKASSAPAPVASSNGSSSNDEWT